jgi:dihydrofolate reductase
MESNNTINCFRNKFDVILYIATSSDGYIADKDGGVDWLNKFNENGLEQNEDSDYREFLKTIDIIFMGRKTYEQIIQFGCDWPYDQKVTCVFTSQKLSSGREDVLFFSDLNGFLSHFNSAGNKRTIWLLGGAQLIEKFSNLNLIDKCIICIIPVSINDGIKLSIKDENFNLLEEKTSKQNVLQKTLIRKA